MKHGACVSEFEAAFADCVNAKHAIAMTNGTCTIEVALRALGVKPGDQVKTTALTMAATTIAILNVGAVPVYCDVNPDTWLMEPTAGWTLPVSLYGLHVQGDWPSVDDAAQTLRRHGGAQFTSYSTQRSKIVNTGEGGVLVTNDSDLADLARSISSLGYRLPGGKSRIDSAAIKSPTYERHHVYPSQNARMNDITAVEGLTQLAKADTLLLYRFECAALYQEVIRNTSWLTPQLVPDGWRHDYWAFAVACDTPARALQLSEAIVRHGGEKPYPAWLLSFSEPAFRRLDPGPDACPVARSLQPRLIQMQTNSIDSATRNAIALRKAIAEIGASS